MNIEERREFRTAIFGYNRKHDGPSMSIVYYVMDGDDILVSTMAERGKAKAVKSPRVSLCVLDEKWPPTYLQVYCDASINSDLDAATDLMMRIAGVMARSGHALIGTLDDQGGSDQGETRRAPLAAIRNVRDPAAASELAGRYKGLDALAWRAPALEVKDWAGRQSAPCVSRITDFLQRSAIRHTQVLARHGSNQTLELNRDWSPASFRLPSPEEPEALAVPSDEGLGPHDSQSVSPIEPAAEQHQRQPGRIVGTSRLDLAFLVKGELLAQKQILGRQRTSGAQAET